MRFDPGSTVNASPQSKVNIAASIKTKLGQLTCLIEDLGLLFKYWRDRRNLQNGLTELQSQPGAAKVHVGEKILVLCRWAYGDSSFKPGIRIDIFVTFSAKMIGNGFEVDSQYDARAYEFRGIVKDNYGDDKEKWQLVFEENFDGSAAQSSAKQQIALGCDPLFELYKGSSSYQKELQGKFSELAAHYDKLILKKAAKAPAAISSNTFRL